MSVRSSTHLVLIPSYNPGPKVLDTVQAARDQWNPVWVVVDGSTDGSSFTATSELADKRSKCAAATAANKAAFGSV